jgi:hypothetical protein
MARAFDAAQDETLVVDEAVVSTTGFVATMAIWANVTSATASQHLMVESIYNGTGAFHSMYIINGTVRVFSWNGGVGGGSHIAEAITTGNNYTANNWFHGCGVFAASDSRAVYIHGANKGTSSDDSFFGGATHTAVGTLYRNDNPAAHVTGKLAWPAIWNVALTDAEVASLAAGAYPPTIRPGSLVSFWPLGGFDTHETDGGIARDIWGGFDMAALSDATGPGVSDHPGGLIYPGMPAMVPAAAEPAPPGGGLAHIIGGGIVI